MGIESGPGREAISQCLHSRSPAVVDQTVRELCRLVSDSKLDLSRGLVELQSSLEESDLKFVPLFVKGLGFLVRVGFKKKNGSWKLSSTENHPFVKILSCGAQVHSELTREVLLFMAKNRQLGMVEVCEFLKPFMNFSILGLPSSDTSSSLFMRQLISSMASLCCSFPNEALPVFKLLISCLQYFPCKNLEEVRNFNYAVESIVDAYIVVLRCLVGMKLPIIEAQLCGVELLETVLSLHTSPNKHTGVEPILEVLKHLLAVQADLELSYVPRLSSAILSLFIILVDTDLEHEQLSILDFFYFLLKWKGENENVVGTNTHNLSEELLVIFPVISLMSSPSKSVKAAATNLLAILERLLVKLIEEAKFGPGISVAYPLISRPESIVFRFLQQLWFQDQYSSSSSFFLNFASTSGITMEEMQNGPRSWISQLKEYCQWIISRGKSTAPVCQSQEMPLVLGAIAAVLVMHPSLGTAAIDCLTAMGVMDPKLGVPLLLAVLYYNNIFTKKVVSCQNLLPKLLGILPSLASHSVMIPLAVQTIMPMLSKDTRPYGVICHSH